MPVTAFGPQGPNYATTRPPADPKASAGVDTWFKNCSAAGAKDGTFATADFFNVIIGNLRYLVRESGVALDDLDDTMVYQAIRHILSGLIGEEGNYGVDTGVLNASLVAIPSVTALTTGQSIFVKMAYTNTGPATIKVGALDVKPIVMQNNLPLIGREFVSGQIVEMIYNGTGWQLLSTLVRPTLTANTTLYVNTTTGSDTLYDGTQAVVSGSNGPFKTWGRAMAETFKYGPSVYVMTISIADGTYTETIATPTSPGPGISVVGNVVTPANVHLISAGGNNFSVNGPNAVSVSGFMVSNSFANSAAFAANGSGASLKTQNTRSGAVTQWVFLANGNGSVEVGSHTFAGNAGVCMAAYRNGSLNLSGAAVFTIASAITVTQFAVVVSGGQIEVPATGTPTFVNPGNVTGQKYYAALNGVINTQGAGVNYFPGTVAGSAPSGMYA